MFWYFWGDFPRRYMSESPSHDFHLLLLGLGEYVWNFFQASKAKRIQDIGWKIESKSPEVLQISTSGVDLVKVILDPLPLGKSQRNHIILVGASWIYIPPMMTKHSFCPNPNCTLIWSFLNLPSLKLTAKVMKMHNWKTILSFCQFLGV